MTRWASDDSAEYMQMELEALSLPELLGPLNSGSFRFV